MEYEDYGRAFLALKHLPQSERIAAYQERVKALGELPLSAWEREMADKRPSVPATELGWMAVGPGDLKAGDVLRPDPRAGATALLITDLPYIAEVTFLAARQLDPGLGLYQVERIGPVEIEPEAFRVSMLCTMDLTLDQDAPAYSEAIIAAASRWLCQSARIVQRLTLEAEEAAQ